MIKNYKTITGYKNIKRMAIENEKSKNKNMDITKIEINEGEQMLVLQLTKEVAEKYNEILKTRNLTPTEFINGALYLFETFTEKQNN